MQATVNLPEAVVHELEVLARSEGTTTADLIERIVAKVSGLAARKEQVRRGSWLPR
jgi:Ribbon-helix-helix protein, copG family